MVRLEKIIWQKVVNTSMLGRARQIGLPRKFYRFSANDSNNYLARVRQNSWLGRLLAPIQKVWGQFILKFNHDKYLKMGLSWQDKIVHNETQIRREMFFEHVQRENFHPYQWLLKSMRRGRFYKIERTMPGFQVPDYIIDEAAQSTFEEASRLEKEYADFVFQNYQSDMTSIAHGTLVAKSLPLEYIVYNGLLKHQSYDRYFYNERYNLQHAAEVKRANQQITEEEKNKLREELKSLNERIPGILTPYGTDDYNFDHVEQLEIDKPNK